jgi:hypothetical protein
MTIACPKNPGIFAYYTDALVHPYFHRLVLQQNTTSVTNIRYRLNNNFQNGWALKVAFLRLGVRVVDQSFVGGPLKQNSTAREGEIFWRMASRPFDFAKGELRLEELKRFGGNRDVQGALKVFSQIQPEGFEKRSLHGDGAAGVGAIGCRARSDFVATLNDAFNPLPSDTAVQMTYSIEKSLQQVPGAFATSLVNSAKP